MQQLTILAVAVLTSKGASGVQGSFVHCAGGDAAGDSDDSCGREWRLILGIDRFHEHVPREL